MPRKPKHEAAVAKRIRKAITDIQANAPTDEGLQKRAQRGSLKLNPTTVAIEAKVDRHLIAGEDCLYAEQYALIAAAMPKKGEAPPLRKQLDDVRKRLAETQADLDLCRTVCHDVMTLMHKQDLELKRLQEELAAKDEEEVPLIGTGRVGVLPTRQSRPRPGSGTARPD